MPPTLGQYTKSLSPSSREAMARANRRLIDALKVLPEESSEGITTLEIPVKYRKDLESEKHELVTALYETLTNTGIHKAALGSKDHGETLLLSIATDDAKKLRERVIGQGRSKTPPDTKPDA